MDTKFSVALHILTMISESKESLSSQAAFPKPLFSCKCQLTRPFSPFSKGRRMRLSFSFLPDPRFSEALNPICFSFPSTPAHARETPQTPIQFRPTPFSGPPRAHALSPATFSHAPAIDHDLQPSSLGISPRPHVAKPRPGLRHSSPARASARKNSPTMPAGGFRTLICTTRPTPANEDLSSVAGRTPISPAICHTSR